MKVFDQNPSPLSPPLIKGRGKGGWGLIMLLLFACSNPIRKLEKETILKRMATLNSFSGVYIETGVAADPQETQIAARNNPFAVYAKNLSKGAASGSVLHYAAGTLSTYYPRSAFGIRYRNVPEIPASEQTRWLEAEYDWHIQNYDIKQLGDDRIAGFETKGVQYTPNADFSSSPFSFEWQASVEPNYAFALQTVMYNKGGNERYRIRFREIEFQKNLTQKDLQFSFPGGTTVAEYDLAGKNFTYAQAAAVANFKLTQPRPTNDFTLKKIIRVQGIIPAFTLYYENMPYQTYYTQVKDYGLNLVPDRGLIIEGRRKYRVNFSGAFRSAYFLENGVYHAVVSSKPLSDLLAWLEGG